VKARLRSIRQNLRRRHIVLISFALLFLSFISINIIAYLQARAMTHFIPTGQRTSPPESLTLPQKLKILLIGVRIPRPINTITPANLDLSFATFRFGGPSRDDCEAWFIPAKGKPKSLVLAFHSYAASKSSLLEAAKAFHDLGYDVLMTDFRGSGGSHGNDTTIGYREANDAAAACDFAAHHWPAESQILFGQSMGGAAILRAIADLNVHPTAVIIESCYDRMLSTVENRFHAMHLPAFPLARLLVYWGGRQFGYSAFNLNPADYATHVSCPVLMMQGGHDPRVTNAQAQNLFDHLAGPKRFELFDDDGHCMFLLNHHNRWIKTVTEFLANNR
jgi:uncharacterized protein